MNEIEQFIESLFVVQCGDLLYLLMTSLEARLLQRKTLLRTERKPSDLLLSQSLLIQVSEHSLKERFLQRPILLKRELLLSQSLLMQVSEHSLKERFLQRPILLKRELLLSQSLLT